MAAHCLPVLLSALLSADPAIASVGPSPAAKPPAQTDAQTTGAPTIGVGACEPRFCFDAQEPWIHGYVQEMPLYGGFHAFRPYNYKHALAQSQIAAGWGMSPTSPYSQQYWHRDHGAAALTSEPAAASALSVPLTPSAVVPAAAWETRIYPSR